MKGKKISLFLVLLFIFAMAGNSFADNYTGSWINLSNGSKVRFDRHDSSKWHVHEKNGTKDYSEHLSDGSKHHKNEGTITRDTKKILEGKKSNPSASDKKAQQDYEKRKSEAVKEEKEAKTNSNKASKEMVKKMLMQ